jgi:hypothetical protein
MVKQKELQLEFGKMERKNTENGILINRMDVLRWKTKMVQVIGGNKRVLKKKDMEHMRGLMDSDTLVNT